MMYTTIALILLLVIVPTCLCAAPQVINDIVYAKVGSRELHLNLVVPDGAVVKPRPAVIWIHGGGWMGGDWKADPAKAYGISNLGYVTGTVEYRLSQEAKYPAQIYDCKAAIRFLRANAAKYGIDPNRIGVWGGSAGGHLVALLGTTGGIKQLEGDLGNEDYSSSVQAVCDLFGPTDLNEQQMKEYIPSVVSMVEGLVGGPVREHRGVARMASPVEFASKGDPPFLILHGDKDPLVPLSQSEELYAKLRAVDIDAKLVVVKNGGHGFAATGTDPSLADIEKMVQEFFRATLECGK